jgi:endonuclease/exonuclease/phosphatase family metal-dependent hydrolase
MRHLLPAVLILGLISPVPACDTVSQEPAVQQAQPGRSPTTAATRPSRPPGTIRVATWNIENWRDHFQTMRQQGTRPVDEAAAEALRQERYQNDEDLWEIAQVFLDPAFSPDVLVFQEGAAQAEIEQFNRDWLNGMFETVRVLPSNDGRGQTIGILLKPGFRIIDEEASYHQMPDPQDLNPRAERLFARGPAFVLVEAPGGGRFWVGTNHQKSKGGGNDVAMTRWRNAEAAATRTIMAELAARGPAELVFMGDVNDEPGVQAYELEGGGDVVATLVGPEEEGFVLATRPLWESGQASFMGYWNATYRSMIDHIVLSPALAEEAGEAGIYDTPWARVASDHLPVYVDLRLGSN